MKYSVEGFNSLVPYHTHILGIDESRKVIKMRKVFEYRDKILKTKVETDMEGEKVVYLN